MKKEDRLKVYNKYSGHCAYCGREIEYKDMQVDHIIPKQRGWQYQPVKGEDVMENYNPSCRRCNFRKGILSIEQFREELKRQCKGIMERSFQVKQSIDYGLLEYHDKPIKFYFEKCGDKIEDYRERYKRIGESENFKKHYEGKSLGEVIEIDC